MHLKHVEPADIINQHIDLQTNPTEKDSILIFHQAFISVMIGREIKQFITPL